MFGIVWLIDGTMKFVFVQSSDITKLIQGAGNSQPAWLHPWFNFWMSSVKSAPSAYLHSMGAIELALGVALIFGFLRKSIYLAGIVVSMMIWTIAEGLGGPYGPGSTDIGAAIMYALIFVAIIIMERNTNCNMYTLDSLIGRKWRHWKHISELNRPLTQ